MLRMVTEIYTEKALWKIAISPSFGALKILGREKGDVIQQAAKRIGHVETGPCHQSMVMEFI